MSVQINVYKLFSIRYRIKFRDFYKFSIVFLLLSACSRSIPAFQSDKQLENKFFENKSTLSELISLCKTLKIGGGVRQAHTLVNTLSTCPFGRKDLDKAGVKEVSHDSKRLYYIFMTDVDKKAYADTFIQEKGYAYFPTPPQSGVVQSGSLDQFVSKELVERKGIREEWRYKKVEGNWYLYYRQYYETFLS
jgi:hypothetical protein